MTEEQAKLILQITDTLKDGITSNHNFTKSTADAIVKCADIIIGLEKRIKTLAFDLVKLYAIRKNTKGFPYSKDSYLQNELESSFFFASSNIFNI